MESKFDHWIKIAQEKANSLMLNSSEWFNKVEEIKELENQEDFTSIEKLIYLLITYARDERDALSEFLRDPSSSPPIDLLSALTLATHYALINKGDRVVDELVNVYNRFPFGTRERLWLLQTMADLGDPKQEGFFESIPVTEIKQGLEAEEQASVDILRPFYPDIDKDPVNVDEKASEYLAVLRKKYIIAMKSRMR